MKADMLCPQTGRKIVAFDIAFNYSCDFDIEQRRERVQMKRIPKISDSHILCCASIASVILLGE